jgi:hypothetical protein
MLNRRTELSDVFDRIHNGSMEFSPLVPSDIVISSVRYSSPRVHVVINTVASSNSHVFTIMRPSLGSVRNTERNSFNLSSSKIIVMLCLINVTLT